MRKIHFNFWSITIALLAIAGQFMHFFILLYDYSLFTLDLFKKIEAVVISTVLCGSLFFFIVRRGTLQQISIQQSWKIEKFNLRDNEYKNKILWFTILECTCNAYYWFKRLIFNPASSCSNCSWYHLNFTYSDWWNFAMAMVFAISIPLIIRSYSGEIMIKMKYEEK